MSIIISRHPVVFENKECKLMAQCGVLCKTTIHICSACINMILDFKTTIQYAPSADFAKSQPKHRIAWLAPSKHPVVKVFIQRWRCFSSNNRSFVIEKQFINLIPRLWDKITVPWAIHCRVLWCWFVKQIILKIYLYQTNLLQQHSLLLLL